MSTITEERHAPVGREGHAALEFAREAGGRSYLARNYAAYPFHLTRPLYFDPAWPELPTLVLQSASGGLFQGDRLSLDITLQASAAAHVTSQSATKVHGMERDHAIQETTLTLGPGAYLELLIDPAILFPDCHSETRTSLTLGPGAVAVIGDSFLWHDPKSSGRPRFAFYQAEFKAQAEAGGLLVLDRYRIARPAEDAATQAFWSAYKAQGSLYVIAREADPDALCAGLRAGLRNLTGCYGGVSALPNQAGAYVRLLAPDGQSLRAALDASWRAARRLITGREALLSWRK